MLYNADKKKYKYTKEQRKTKDKPLNRKEQEEYGRVQSKKRLYTGGHND